MAAWKWDYEAFGELLCGPEMQSLLAERVDKGRAAAEGMAPTAEADAWLSERTPEPHAGLYRDSFETEVGVRETNKGRRAVGVLRNTAPYAAGVEFGNGRVQAHHVLARSLDFM